MKAVFRAEICAARLEGALRADADLAAYWRGVAGVQEACASAWLEDLSIRPDQLLCRDFRDRVGDPDRDRAAASASAILRGLHAPGDLLSETEAVLARLWSLAAGPLAEPLQGCDRDAVRAALREAESPILGGLAVARIVAEASRGQAPAVERLAFVAADHALRGSGRFMLGEAPPHELVAAPRGRWVVQPALALVDNGFRLWSVTREDRIEELITGLTRSLERGLGSLPVLRRWLEELRRIRAAAHGASRMPDFLDLLLVRPILSAPTVVERLQVTPRGAQKLIEQAASHGMIANVTPRQTYRAWAAAPFARLLRG
ncbi:helix-turn-helix domain-containing protein [Pseudooceanicola nanhaiensis]|uniref:helix-turn-helix domain-containing protein n=1 Tax=Pseudooceanicola nanhaiensis TaxID=375761 RepID=UPI0021E573C5|nr:helix-turn-helix domain-containing protein [Pseudooceanicola nanhaiensis]